MDPLTNKNNKKINVVLFSYYIFTVYFFILFFIFKVGKEKEKLHENKEQRR
jgi:phosphotransferase system  glucose/maltose/N-acetylglucosamine-specific IIC component